MMNAAARLFGVGLVALAASQASAAVVIDFDTNADYDSNFVEVNNGSAVSRDAAGYLAQGNTGSASAFIYNAGATGGSGGSGGTTFTLPRSKFGGTAISGGFTIQADIYQATLNENGTSFGFYVKTNDASSSAYAGLFRLYSNTNSGAKGANFRLFDSNGSPSSAGVGTGLVDVSSGALPTSLAVDTWYTVKIEVIDTVSGVSFTPSIWTQGGGSLVWGFATVTDTSTPVLGEGQVGVRLSSTGSSVRVDNFAITPVPEPATLALAGLAGIGLVRRRR